MLTFIHACAHTHIYTQCGYTDVLKWNVVLSFKWSSTVLTLAPYAEQAVTGLSPQWPGFSPGQSVWHLWFQRLAMRQVSLRSAMVFSCQYHSIKAPYSVKYLSLMLYNTSQWQQCCITHLENCSPRMKMGEMNLGTICMFVPCINSIKTLFYYSKLMHTIIKS